jgi:hypothetical protein
MYCALALETRVRPFYNEVFIGNTILYVHGNGLMGQTQGGGRGRG